MGGTNAADYINYNYIFTFNASPFCKCTYFVMNVNCVNCDVSDNQIIKILQ